MPARRVLNVVAQPFSNDGAAFTLTCSIGMALAPSHGSSVDELTRHADAAMRAVKTAGRANFRLHQMRGEVDRRESMRLDHAMRQALVSNRFRLHYQPQVDLATGMNRPGGTSPSSGSRQRISASAPITVPVARSTCGW